jgi:type IV fimbrial biogenesis protein FimT
MIFMKKTTGFTLVELVTVIAVISILVMFSAPFFNSLLRSYEANQVFNRLYLALSEARIKASTLHSPIGLCGSSDAVSCTNNWNKGALLFIDQNSNRVLDSMETVINYYSTDIKYGQLSWRGAGGSSSQVLLYTAERGRLDMSNGSFWYCAGENYWHRVVILPKIGNPRRSKDRNGDGIHETASGINISC